jgi:hypothetical protein
MNRVKTKKPGRLPGQPRKETPMNIDDVIEQVKGAESAPVLCKFPAMENDIDFDGNLADFLALVAQFCHKPVMVWRFVFDDGYFKTEINAESEGEFIDVRTLAPKTRRFESHLDANAGYQLLAWMKDTNATIAFSELDPWLNEFLDEKNAAVKAYNAGRVEAIAQERDARRQSEQALLARVESLIDDPAFCALKTHRAMYAYAVEKIEGLSELRDTKVKPIIAQMADKIGMKKHIKGG